MNIYEKIKAILFKKEASDNTPETENLQKSTQKRNGRFLDTRSHMSPTSKSSPAGIAYGELISRNTKIINANILALVIIAGLVGKEIFLDKPVTVVTPPNMNEEIRVIGNKASESYKTQWALFYSTMLGNINPKNIQFIMDYIIKSLSPELQGRIAAELQSQINIMQTRGVDQTFTPIDIYFDEKNDMVYVWGTKTTKLTNVSDKQETSKWTYEWVIGLRQGMPRIAYANQYAGTPNIKKITINGKEQLEKLDNPPTTSGE